MSSRSGRPGMKDRTYLRNKAKVLAESDICHLCGHAGARTADHIISKKRWPPGVPGFDDVANLAPAHGTMGRDAVNPCPMGCGNCNQRRGTKPLVATRSRDW